jgi:hypothetical protein
MKVIHPAFAAKMVAGTWLLRISTLLMSLSDFRSWCTLLPSSRKFLGNLLMPPDSGLSYSCHSAGIPKISIFISEIK